MTQTGKVILFWSFHTLSLVFLSGKESLEYFPSNFGLSDEILPNLIFYAKSYFLAWVVSIWRAKSINQKPVKIFSQNFAHIYVHNPFGTHVNQKKNLEVYLELSLNWSAHIIFFHCGKVLCIAWEEDKYKKKLQVIVNLPCLGYNTGKKNILMHLLMSTKEFTNKGVVIQLVRAPKPVSWFLMLMTMTVVGRSNTSEARPGVFFFRNYA